MSIVSFNFSLFSSIDYGFNEIGSTSYNYIMCYYYCSHQQVQENIANTRPTLSYHSYGSISHSIVSSQLNQPSTSIMITDVDQHSSTPPRIRLQSTGNADTVLLYANPLSSPQNPLHYTLQHTVRPAQLDINSTEPTEGTTLDSTGRGSPFHLRNDDNMSSLRRCCCSVLKRIRGGCHRCSERCHTDSATVMAVMGLCMIILVMGLIVAIVAMAPSDHDRKHNRAHKEKARMVDRYDDPADTWHWLVKDNRR